MLIITGSIAYDYIMDFPGIFGDHIMPDKIHNINVSFIVNKFERRCGGVAGNISYNLGLLSTHHTLFSYAGKDFEEYKKHLEKVGVSTKNVLIDRSLHTATGFVMADKNHNQIWGYFYGAADNNYKLKLNSIAKKIDLVVVGPTGAKSSMNMVKQCIKSKTEYIFDPGFILTEVSDENLELGISHASIIIGNDYEITLIKRRVKKWKSLFKDKIIITTLGAKGSQIETGDKIISIKPVKPKKAVDPTGAGDAWRAGFLAGYQRGFDLKICGQMGSVASTYAIENYGTQEHHFTIEQFKKRYSQSYKTMLNL
ncbi:MAG: PfkB family carbohydrate kinase [Actinobacteria bacterium]|nr:PfkB family carbohydrate kinase [Actinomycetota bacterium]